MVISEMLQHSWWHTLHCNSHPAHPAHTVPQGSIYGQAPVPNEAHVGHFAIFLRLPTKDNGSEKQAWCWSCAATNWFNMQACPSLAASYRTFAMVQRAFCNQPEMQSTHA